MAFIIAALVIIADQLTKYLYVSCGAGDITLIPGLLGLTYVENRGAAWGMFGDHQLLLYIFSGLVTAAILGFYIWKYKKMNALLRIALALVIAGAVGNLIDRIMLNYVRDMIRFLFIDFPIFNVADSAITIGGALILIDVIFFEKDETSHDGETVQTEQNENGNK